MANKRCVYPEEKTYTYWFIYIKLTNDDNEFIDSELYALTDNKELFKKFTNERNMDMFFTKKMKINYSQMYQIALDKAEYRLEEITGTTKSRSQGSEKVEFSLVVTQLEKMTCMNSCFDFLYSKIWTYTVVNPMIFNNEIMCCLSYIGYTDGFMVFNSNIDGYPDTSILYRDLHTDFLGAFIHFYGKTIKRSDK